MFSIIDRMVIFKGKALEMIEIKKKNENGFQFLVKSETGKILLKSVPFSNKKEVERTLKGLHIANSPLKHFERKTNFDGKFLFNLKNEDGTVIGSSGLYSSEAGMENGIKNLKSSFVKTDTF